MIYDILLIILLVLQVADWWTSRAVLAAGGREANRVVRWLINALGYEWGLAVAKLFVAVVILVAAVVPKDEWWWPWEFALLLGGYLWVVINNVTVLRAQAR